MKTSQRMRASEGGLIDRNKVLQFRFDHQVFTGHPGDTLASALLANGVKIVGRSFKYHRPRGILSAGSEEPNALVTLNVGSRAEPNTRATQVELYDGLIARSQHAWPSLQFDMGEVADLLSPLFPAGFYYKTFIGGPKGAWSRFYEPVIRRMAGLGCAPSGFDPDTYDKRHAHCDVLVVGAGAAGLAAAQSAAAGGARVILVDEQPVPGGSLLSSTATIDARPAFQWASLAAARFANEPQARLLVRTTAFGLYDHNLVMAVERLTDHDPALPGPRQRLWQIRAKHVVLATGAHEQPLLFANNDRPGVLLASAAQRYAREYAVLVGRRVVVATNNDSAYDAARAVAAVGAEVVEIIDGRATGPAGGSACYNSAVRRVLGHRHVRGVEVVEANGRTRRISCDAVLMSGGWQPAIHLYSHVGGRSRYDPRLGCFVPEGTVPGVTMVGACTGQFQLRECLASGDAAGIAVAGEAGRYAAFPAPTTLPDKRSTFKLPAFEPRPRAKSFVDFQNDVTTADVDLAHREGFISVEHLKRYTTTGMATDQGKTSNLNALTRLAERLGSTPGEVGTTTFRPPYSPVTFGSLAALDRGDLVDPVRTTAIHGWHSAHGAVFENVGQWKRPWYYPRENETMAEAVGRECQAVRNAVGLFDASTLGKIEMRGPDATEFLNLVYTNNFSSLGIGRCRYGVMCNEDGMILDDGVTTRTGPEQFLMTTTTGNAGRVLDHLEKLLQTEWPHLKVYLTCVTEHWSVCVVAGPRARQLLTLAGETHDASNETFPHLSMREGSIAGVPVRLYRISFSGELAYEVHAPAKHAVEVWERLYEVGTRCGVSPYGTEAMHVLRAEKGYIIVGQETDGSVTPVDLGLGWAIDSAKADFVGKRSMSRPELTRQDRKQLVGLMSLDEVTVLAEGAQIVETPSGAAPIPMSGHVTSSYWSPALERPFALALLARGQSRHGETVFVRDENGTAPCRVCSPVFYDPSGERMRA